MPSVELTRAQHQAIQQGRRAMLNAIAERDPDEAPALFIVAACGLFADIIRSSLAAGHLVELANAELRDVGLELRPVRRN